MSGDLYVGGVIHVPNTVSDTVQLNGNIASTSQVTGTLTVQGGVARRSPPAATGAGPGVSGDLYCQSTWNLSDRRLKKNVTVIPDALDRVCALNGCTFQWNEKMHGLEDNNSVGLIAQEVYDQAPLCVSHDPISDYYAVGSRRG